MSAQQKLRTELRARRSALSDAVRYQYDRAIQTHLRNHWNELGWPTTIAAYWAFDGEPDLLNLLQRLAQGGKTRVALPVLDGQQLRFACWSLATPMANNRFGIPEPDLGAADVLPIANLDVILMPLVGFDDHGNRLGLGGGFYDQTLASYATADSPQRIGVAYEEQRAQLSPQAWDIKLHAVVTPGGFRHFD